MRNMEVLSVPQREVLLCLLLILLSMYTNASQPFIGVVVNTGIDHLAKPALLSQFLNATFITNVRMNFDESFIRAIQDTTISSLIVDAIHNKEIPSVAIDKDYRRYIVDSHVKSRYNIVPKVQTLLVGDKVFEYEDQSILEALVPVMENLQGDFDSAGLSGKVKVSTIISTNTLTRSDIPSEASFKPAYHSVIIPLLQFLRRVGSALYVSIFPYYEYAADATPHTYNLCTFQPNSGRLDPITGKTYTNMFAIKVDSMRSALDGLGFPDIKIVVAETGWPTYQNETQFAEGMTQSRLYNWNLIQYLRSNAGTPLMPKKSVDTYIYSLFDRSPHDSDVPDELKSCGFLHEDLSWKYDLLCLRK